MITVAAPNPSIDKVLEVSALQPGGIHRPHAQVAVPGGKGLNVARVAATLGAQVHVVGIAAGATGQWIARSLEEVGVPASWVWTDGENRSCTSVADATTNELTEFYEPGPTISDDAWAAFAELVDKESSNGQWLALSGSLPPGVNERGLATLVGPRDRRLALDTSGEALRATISASVDLVKLNTSETAELLGRTGPGDQELIGLAAGLRRRCRPGSTVVVTGGQEGALMIDPDGHMLRARLPIIGNYPVGSGDAFLAGLLTGNERGQSWAEALRLATAVAGANAEVPGAGLFDAQRVEDLLPLVNIEEEGRCE